MPISLGRNDGRSGRTLRHMSNTCSTMRDLGVFLRWATRSIANAGSAFKIMQLDSLMMFNAPRMYELYLRYAKTSFPLSMRHAEQIPPEPVLDAASISHVVIATDLKEPLAEMTARGHERVFDDGLVRIFRRVSLPRYFFTSDFELTKKRYALQDIGAPHAPRDIIVESEPPFATRSSRRR